MTISSSTSKTDSQADSSSAKLKNTKLDSVYELVAKDFAQMNAQIPHELSSDVELVEEISRYIVEAGGKRFRPLLVLLTSGLFSAQSSQSNQLAIVIEFLHTATLLHDDVVDHSSLRRGRLTANEKWGNPPSVLVGDFLYSRAFQLMVNIGNLEVMKILSNATNLIAEGEVMQLANLGNAKLSVESYREVINCKTALLFESAAHSSGVLANHHNPKLDSEAIGCMRAYGHHFGMAYQLIDDLLDYVGDKTVMGKNTGDDLAEGKLTLPIILAIRDSQDPDRQILTNALERKSASDLDRIVSIIESTGSLEKTKSAAMEEILRARACLEKLPDNEYRNALEILTNHSAERIF